MRSPDPMNRAALFGFCLLFPALCLAFWGLTRVMVPIFGYGLALAVYWAVLIGLMIWQRQRIVWPARPFWPSKPVVAIQIVMIIGVTGASALAIGEGLALPFWAIIAVIVFALCNGTLEEMFWRGTAMGKSATKRDAVLVLAAFTLWHVALLFATGVVVTGGAAGMLGGAFAGGAVWSIARMQTGNPAFAIVGHVLFNLAAFTELALRNV